MSNDQSPPELDHVAIEVADLDRHLATFERLGLTLKRMGIRSTTGQRIALLGATNGMKLELIEATGHHPSPTFDHVAFRVPDVAAAHSALVDDGYLDRRAPSPLPAAHAETAFVASVEGLDVQLIRYEPDSPDL